MQLFQNLFMISQNEEILHSSQDDIQLLCCHNTQCPESKKSKHNQINLSSSEILDSSTIIWDLEKCPHLAIQTLMIVVMVMVIVLMVFIMMTTMTMLMVRMTEVVGFSSVSDARHRTTLYSILQRGRSPLIGRHHLQHHSYHQPSD